MIRNIQVDRDQCPVTQPSVHIYLHIIMIHVGPVDPAVSTI